MSAITVTTESTAPIGDVDRRTELVLKGLAASAFVIFFNSYMMAPLIPALAREFSASEHQLGWIVPAYLLPYGLSTLFYGALSDRFGRRLILLTLLGVSIFTTFLISAAWSAESLIGIRIIAGLSSGGIVTIALTLVADLYPYQKLGRALGWMFGGIAGGMAFGATLGAWLNPHIGWRNEYIILSLANVALFIFLFKQRAILTGAPKDPVPLKQLVRGYQSLLKTSRGARTFTFIFINGIFHGGVFSWLGYYLSVRYHLSDEGIGQALLGYGVPGMFLGPIFGRLADHYGRSKFIPAGFLVASACAFLLVPDSPLWIITIAVTILSIGLDMTHPLLSAIVASLDPKRRGQAMGFNTFLLFMGLGLGSVTFQFLIARGLNVALLTFGGLQLLFGVIAFRSFRAERKS